MARRAIQSLVRQDSRAGRSLCPICWLKLQVALLSPRRLCCTLFVSGPRTAHVQNPARLRLGFPGNILACGGSICKSTSRITRGHSTTRGDLPATGSSWCTLARQCFNLHTCRSRVCCFSGWALQMLRTDRRRIKSNGEHPGMVLLPLSGQTQVDRPDEPMTVPMSGQQGYGSHHL